MRSAGLPIEELIDYVGLVLQGDSTIEERKEILKKQRGLLEVRMQELQKTLEILNYKISTYEKAILKKEQNIIRSNNGA
jgi:DNA-binding transcriptional MerR regulator